MPIIPSAFLRNTLARHLDDLRQALAVLGERLRDAIAHSVGGTVSGTAREVVRALLAGPESVPLSGPPSLPASEWGFPHRPAGNPYDENDDSWTRNWPDRQGYEDDPPAVSSPAPVLVAAAPFRWVRALAVGCQTIAWWLRRHAGQGPIWATLGLGILVALAAYRAGAALSGAALSLLALADTRIRPRQRWRGPCRDDPTYCVTHSRFGQLAPAVLFPDLGNPLFGVSFHDYRGGNKPQWP